MVRAFDDTVAVAHEISVVACSTRERIGAAVLPRVEDVIQCVTRANMTGIRGKSEVFDAIGKGVVDRTNDGIVGDFAEGEALYHHVADVIHVVRVGGLAAPDHDVRARTAIHHGATATLTVSGAAVDDIVKTVSDQLHRACAKVSV